VSFEGPGVAVIVGEPAEPPVVEAPKSDCVVKADTHVGMAVKPGKVCSYHTMHYHSDGTRREGLASNRPDRAKATKE
jgi:hypothetical protein